MKKIALFILGVLLFIPVVFADMGAPGIQQYKATIVNKDGAIIFEQDYDETAGGRLYKNTNKKVEYGKTVEIGEEEDGYGLVYDVGYLKLTDLEPIKKNYTLIEKEWDSKIEGIILRESEMRTGPANGYPSLGVTLVPGTKVSVREYKDSDGMYSWVYIEYNGKKGFIDAYQGAVTLGTDKAYFMTYADTDFLNPATHEKIGVIKANTVIEGTYYKLDAWSRAYYFEKGNIKGVIKYADLAQRHVISEGKLIKDVKLYKSFDLENIDNSEVVTTLKAGTSIRNNISYANFSEYVYYQNGNISGWIIDGDYDEKTESNIYVVNYTKTNIKDSYVVKESNTLDVELIHTTTPDPTTPSDTEPVNPNESEPVSPDVLDDEDVSGFPKNTTIYLYIAGAVILFLLAVVIILLINRKK